MKYWYGMRLRPFGIGCQPKGVAEHIDDPTGYPRRYWSLIAYDHELTEKECFNYDLDKVEFPPKS